MAIALGKRKRGQYAEQRSPLHSRPAPGVEETEEESALQDILRRHFEARFIPLPTEPKSQQKSVVEETKEDPKIEEGEWEGFSEEERPVEVVDSSVSVVGGNRSDRKELKAFMSSKPPSATGKTPRPSTTKPMATGSDDEDDKTNLKNDVELQRLLKESHLLDPSSTSTSALTGKNRHKALDMRLQAIGAKSSILAQEKMPMSHRKGIIAKGKEREERRRREAKDAGIILERENRHKKPEGRRERGVGGPGVGKFRGGTLVLDKKDLASIRGPKKVLGKKGKKR
ncbi:hypothetical protein LTS18_003555 [Coniosporium uncinatum]|uniref:Uncharacterized protein n=1 Tax=Coniosporium uncinatum TaxID=93489 RepID=A0ACC3DTB6_9PEZI|nr:hypothetical protein LTS18_003555 [Coniosporium uncinatum]